MQRLITTLIAISFLCAGIILERWHVPQYFFNKLTGKTEIRQELNLTYDLPVQDELISVFGTPKQFMPLDAEYIGKTEPEVSENEDDTFDIKSYTYTENYDEALRYLTSENIKEQAKTLYTKLWHFDGSVEDLMALKEKRKIELAMALGLNERYPGGDILTQGDIKVTKKFNIKKMTLRSRIPEMTVPVFFGESKNTPKKAIVITLHGNDSNPEKVMGMGKEDYTRQFGKNLMEKGYTVFAPYTFSLSKQNKHLSALGMLYAGQTYLSLDLQKLKALLDHIKNNDELKDLPIICYGVAEGGRLAAILGVLDYRVDMVVASGAMGQWQRELEQAFLPMDNTSSTPTEEVIYNIPLLQEFAFSDLAKLLSPRPLIIEAGSYDNKSKTGATAEWKRIKGWYDTIGYPERLKLVWFQGYQEAMPELSEPFFAPMLK